MLLFRLKLEKPVIVARALMGTLTGNLVQEAAKATK